MTWAQERPPAGGTGSQSVQSLGGDNINVTRLPQLLGAIEAGEYRPSPDSVGDRLAASHPCEFHRSRSLARFARAALRYEGIWWPLILEAAPEMVADHEADYVAACWREWIDGNRPFRRGRRVPR